MLGLITVSQANYIERLGRKAMGLKRLSWFMVNGAMIARLREKMLLICFPPYQ